MSLLSKTTFVLGKLNNHSFIIQIYHAISSSSFCTIKVFSNSIPLINNPKLRYLTLGTIDYLLLLGDSFRKLQNPRKIC